MYLIYPWSFSNRVESGSLEYVRLRVHVLPHRNFQLESGANRQSDVRALVAAAMFIVIHNPEMTACLIAAVGLFVCRLRFLPRAPAKPPKTRCTAMRERVLWLRRSRGTSSIFLNSPKLRGTIGHGDYWDSRPCIRNTRTLSKGTCNFSGKREQRKAAAAWDRSGSLSGTRGVVRSRRLLRTGCR
jgi:hypothetical protein